MPSRSILKIIFTLALSVFMNKLVFCEAVDTILFPETYPGTFTRLNHISQSHGHSNYQEILKMYYSLFSDKELFGKAGIIGSSILSISAGSRNVFDGSSVASEINDTDVEEALSSKSSQHPGIPFAGSSQNNCFVDVQRLFKNVKENEWTWPFLDSWGKPGPSILLGRLIFVGNYKECRSSKAPPPLPDEGGSAFKGNYCVLNFAAKPGLGTMSLTQASLFGSLPLQIGSCMPDSCTESEITGIVQEGLNLLNVSSSLVAMPTECRSDQREYTSATVASIVLLSIILALLVCGTLFDLLVIQRPKWAAQDQGDDCVDSGLENAFSAQSRFNYLSIPDVERTIEEEVTSRDQAPMNGDSLRSREELYNTSGTVLLKEHEPLLGKEKIEPKASICCGVLSQILLSFSVYTNGSKVLNTSQPPGSLTAVNGIRCLSMSWVVLAHVFDFGLPTAANVVDELPVRLRQWTADAISNAFVSVDTFFTLSGLLVAYLTTKEISKKGWKIKWGLFYFHRFWRSHCFGHSWYLANDMQFFILSPLMLIPFYFNVYAGLLSCGIFLLAQWITTGVLSSDNEWSPTLIGLNIKVKPGSLDYMIHYYITPYCRMGPYIVGILAGYLLAVNNGRVRLNKVTVFIGWAVSTASGLAIVYGLRGDVGGENPSSVGAAALYNAVARSAWGACVCWVIIACSSGYGGPVNTLLSWSPFVALSRLTYMAYLIHPCLLNVYYGNQESLYNLNDTNTVVTYLGILLFTYVASFVLMLGLESPWIGLEKVFLKNNRH
uniref:Nose resistant-to-fluoxetine protein N-terminal domain-containing protein n=1 Tax=Biomphalaria glabrata TaxID=6526 RepID=A0A2C9M3A4_BIOGL